MCYPVCEMVHVKEPILLIGKSSPCIAGSRFLFHYLSGTNVLYVPLNKTFLSFIQITSIRPLNLCIFNSLNLFPFGKFDEGIYLSQ